MWNLCVIANCRNSITAYEEIFLKGVNEQKAYIQVYRMKNLLIISGSELQGTVQEVENLRKEVDKLKHCGETDLGVNLKPAVGDFILLSPLAPIFEFYHAPYKHIKTFD